MHPLRPLQVQESQATARRELLWNVSEPGDPYDIKKSMIAKMPGDKKIFMGNHLDLVCLLQAAQIQRLVEFLQDYKLKFREIERSNLDRHSYEIQIKELTQRLADQENFKGQNTKLVEFIKRQQVEIEFLQKNSRDSSQSAEGLKNTYQRSLQIANQLTNQNIELKRQLEDLRIQVMNFKARYEALEKSKNRQIEEMKLHYAQSSREGYENSLNSLKIQYQSEIRKYDLEVKRLKELNDAKNSEINDLMSQREDLVRRLTANEGKADLQRQLYQYENKFVLFGQEIERLNIALRDYTNKLEESEMRKRELQRAAERNQYERREVQGKLRSKDSEIAHLSDVIMRYEIESKKLGENQQYLIQYEQQITSLQRDVADLNSKLKYQTQVSRKYKQQAERLNFQLSKSRLLEKQNYELRGQAQELASYRRKIAESENRAAILKEEIERLKSIIASKDNQIERSRTIFSENQSNKSKIRELESTIVNKYEFEISRIKADYDQKIQLITRKTGSEIQGKSQFYQNELEKINQALRLKTQEAEKLRTRSYELQTLLSRGELQTSAKLRNYEASITNLTRENEELFNKIRVLADTDRKAYELQSKLGQYEREIDRITQSLRGKDQQILNLRNRLRETEGVSQKYESDIIRKVTVYEQTISSVRSENDELRRKLNELISQSNRKILEASQEIDRLGKNLLKLKEQKNQMELTIRQATQEIEFQRQRAQKISAENQELRRKLTEMENKYQMIYSDSTSHLRALQQENQTLRRQLAESKATLNRYEGEMSRVSSSLEQTLTTTGRENENLKAKLIQLSQQFERLNGMLKNKTQQCNDFQAKYRKIYVDYETTVKQFREYEISVKTKYEGEVSQNYANYERSIESLKAENEELRRKIIDFENKYRQFYQQSSQELENLRRQLNQKDSSYSNIQVQYNKKISIYESNVVNLTRVNEELQKKLKDLDSYTRQRAEECSRLQALLMTANSDLENLKRQWKDSQYSIVQKYDTELTKRQSIYEQNLSRANAEIEQLRRKLQQVGGDSSRRLSEFEMRYNQLTQEYEKLKSNYNILGQQKDVYQKKIQAYETSITNYQNEVKRRIQAYDQNIINLNKENQELRRRLQQSGDLGRRNAEYESKIALMSQQIQRLHGNIKNLGQENDSLRRQINEKISSLSQYELEVSRKVSSLQQNLEGLQRENNDLKRKITDYEQRLYGMSQELERVNTTLKSKSDETLRLEQTIKVTYEQTISQVRRQNEELNRKLKETGDVNRRYNQLQNKLVLSSQEIQRLTQSLRLKQEELTKMDQINRNQANDLDAWRRKLAEMEANYTQTFEVEVTKKYALYEQNLADLRKKNGDYETKLVGAMQEIERLNNVLRLKVQESTQLTNKLSSMSSEIEEYRRRLRQMEGVTNQQYASLKNQRDELYRKFQQLQLKLRQNDQAYERKLSQYENRIKIMTQQIQRLNEVLLSKNGQFQQVKRQFKEYQESVAMEVKGNYGQYEMTVSNLNKELDEVRRKLTEVTTRNKEYQNKLIMTSQEIDRLDNIIKLKSQEVGASKRENEEVRRQYEELRRRWEESNQVTRRIPEYEQKISLLIKENQRYQIALREKTDEVNTLNNKLRQFQLDLQASRRQLNEYEVEINRKVSGYEQGTMQLRRENQELLRRKGEYQSKIALMSQQLQRLNGMLKSKNQEFLRLTQQFESFKRSKESQYNQNYTIVVQEYEIAKKHLIQYEESIRKLHAEFERLQTILHQLKQERDSLIEKNRFLSAEISRLTGENKDLEEQARDVRLRLTDETALQKRITEHLGLMVVLFAEIETLRQRVRDKQMEVVEVRKSSLAPNMV